MEIENIVREVNYIIIRNLDAQEGYKEAAENVDNDELRKALYDESERRESYARELQQEIKQLNANAAETTSMEAIWNRLWIEIKGLFATQDDSSIIEECRKADSEALVAYDTIIDIGDRFLPSRIYNIITKQRQEIALTYQALMKYHDLKIV